MKNNPIRTRVTLSVTLSVTLAVTLAVTLGVTFQREWQCRDGGGWRAEIAENRRPEEICGKREEQYRATSSNIEQQYRPSEANRNQGASETGDGKPSTHSNEKPRIEPLTNRIDIAIEERKYRAVTGD